MAPDRERREPEGCPVDAKELQEWRELWPEIKETTAGYKKFKTVLWFIGKIILYGPTGFTFLYGLYHFGLMAIQGLKP